MDTLIPVVLCGGSGTRMWPLSRAGHPKQLLALSGERTLLQQTVGRLAGLDVAAPIVVTNEAQRFMVYEQLAAIGCEPAHIIAEPAGRNTAPAAAAAALLALRDQADALLLLLPSDHLIRQHAHFQALVETALPAARDGLLVTFGIRPDCAHTGYGYIRQGEALAGGALHRVAEFVEKPDTARAEAFVAGGQHYWNSGMFLFRADAYLAELQRLQPDMLAAVTAAVEAGHGDPPYFLLGAERFAEAANASIDYAVMEHTDRAAMIAAEDLGWSDIGSWSALAEVCEQDEAGNNLVGDVIAEAASDCYIRAESSVVAAIGVDHLVIVQTADAVLVTTKDKAQDVKKVVERLNADGRAESLWHRRVHRPWGSYEGIDTGERFQVKHIVVKPGAALSLQMHFHRAEHWIVVRGTARVVCGDEVRLLTENQSTYIPLGTVHRLENPGKVPLELIEVQSGAYLGEDDIVRLDDQYGRDLRAAG
ncbi:mannose-1-phosphate guanylyltransferase/mannose-6-phosphate isomerase [Chitinolyticbacter meiyuanensis]|uniref:mannose-1-phosphate guanylyltransferase/mannose-6-phosphate isomerase n=1 Tax=Chitinolyticbacter meiyuanensis TaxID=682798 RepID=UPI0011E59DEA|nr:mannose-1-phosphate guanylyltransferase/mannose-6-phosphate isomerase [Chitinolyticbacter meiyuanensis]